MPIYRPPSSTRTYPIRGVASCTTGRIHTPGSNERKDYKVSIDPHVELLLGLVSAAAWLMTKAGLSKNVLELKRRRVVCPSCGRHDYCTCV